MSCIFTSCIFSQPSLLSNCRYVVYSIVHISWEALSYTNISLYFIYFLICLFLWSPYVIGQTIIFLPGGFFFLLFFISWPNLSRRRLDVCHTSTHGAALVRISDAGLKRAARCRWKYTTQKSRQKSPSGHHRTTLSGYIFATEAYIDNRKKTC